MKPAWFVHGSFKTICSFDGIHILQIGHSQKRKEINLSFLNHWLFNFFPCYAKGQAFSYAKVVVKIKNGKLCFKWKPWEGSSHSWIFCCILLHVPAQEEVLLPQQEERRFSPCLATIQPMRNCHHPELLLSSNRLSFKTAPLNSLLFSVTNIVPLCSLYLR